MAKNGFKVMDSDMHVVEPLDLWERYTEPAFRDRAPKGISRARGDMQIELEGHLMPAEPDNLLISKSVEQVDIYKEPEECGWDSASQVRAMDAEGIDVSIIFPSRGLYALALDSMDPDLGTAIAKAYNNWMYDFCSYEPGRMYGAGMVSPFDVTTAIEEARRCVEEMGFKAIFLRPNIVENRNWHDPYYDPLWAEIERLGVPVGFHEGTYAAMNEVGKRFDTYVMFHTCSHPMELMLAVVSIVGGGVLERFPALKVAFLEGNCSWAPYLMWRMDEHVEFAGAYEPNSLTMDPSKYFRRQCYVSIEADELPAKVIEDFDFTDRVVFSTDYPHNDSKYPHATENLLKLPLKKETKRKVLWDNCADLYSIS